MKFEGIIHIGIQCVIVTLPSLVNIARSLANVWHFVSSKRRIVVVSSVFWVIASSRPGNKLLFYSSFSLHAIPVFNGPPVRTLKYVQLSQTVRFNIVPLHRTFARASQQWYTLPSVHHGTSVHHTFLQTRKKIDLVGKKLVSESRNRTLEH